MRVCNLDYRMDGTLGDDALMTERLYLDDHLTEDLADSDLRPVSGLLVACIEPDNRPKRWSRPVLAISYCPREDMRDLGRAKIVV